MAPLVLLSFFDLRERDRFRSRIFSTILSCLSSAIKGYNDLDASRPTREPVTRLNERKEIKRGEREISNGTPYAAQSLLIVPLAFHELFILDRTVAAVEFDISINFHKNELSLGGTRE